MLSNGDIANELPFLNVYGWCARSQIFHDAPRTSDFDHVTNPLYPKMVPYLLKKIIKIDDIKMHQPYKIHSAYTSPVRVSEYKLDKKPFSSKWKNVYRQ